MGLEEAPGACISQASGTWVGKQKGWHGPCPAHLALLAGLRPVRGETGRPTEGLGRARVKHESRA